MNKPASRLHGAFLLVILSCVFASCPCPGQASVTDQDRQIALQFDPQRTSITFTLADVLHTVHGTFQTERGSLDFDSASGNLGGEIVVDARSGQSGNSLRDRKMRREILESERYPEIAFRADRIDGTVLPLGKSSVRVKGVFSIHGADHELTVPASVEIFPDRWTAALHFSIPYVKWGMKNPSTLFLRVSESVDIDVNAAGVITRR